jgi:hypothetical protein
VLSGSKDRMTLATTGLGLGQGPPAAEAVASCQACETMVGHFMSHTERSARLVSRCFASSAMFADRWYSGERFFSESIVERVCTADRLVCRESRCFPVLTRDEE